MKILLDAGHGGNDPGAVNGKLHEADAALDIVYKVGKILSLNGVKVYYSRKCDIVVELDERTDLANALGVDYFCSIHLNSFSSPSARGIETYHYPGSKKGAELAKIIQKNLIAATGAVDRGVKTAKFYVLKHTNAPAVLVETGFISNHEEGEKLFDDEYQNRVAKAIAEGILAMK